MPETVTASGDLRSAEQDLGRFFKALADDTRRAILSLLERHERNVSEIVARFPLTQPTISRHLQVLREAHLVRCERRGQHVIYRLDEDALALAANVFFARFRACRKAGFEVSVDRLPAHSPLSGVEAAKLRDRIRFNG